jgi:hypothetical protein
MRFFFDYTTTGQALYDYRGDEFLNAAAAYEYAETTAQLLKNKLNGDWRGWSIEVRNATGGTCFCLAVDNVEVRADE